MGNLIDSCFYGLIFDKGMTFDPQIKDYTHYSDLAKFSKKGYSSFLHGNVVDMLYFPIWENKAKNVVYFFSPIFNLADASISTGVISILVFQKRFFKHRKKEETHHTIETGALVNDESQIS